ncbi:MAG: hypothetical protein AAFV53_00800 [Myxococcota bacterium]
MRAMRDAPPEGWRCVLVDLQGASHDGLSRIEMALGTAGLGPAAMAEEVGRIEAVSVGGLASIKRAGAAEETPIVRFGRMVWIAVGAARGPLVLMLDEVPWWLDALKPEDARRTLAVLRHLRQEHPTLRMVLTGSVGLAGLTISLQASAEINDLDVIELGPLSAAHGATLFERHLLDGGRQALPEAAQHAHRLVNGSPYWLRVLAGRTRTERVDIDEVEFAATQLISGRMRHTFANEGQSHLRRRYGTQEPIIRAVLTAASQHEKTSRNVLISAALAAGCTERQEAAELIGSLVDAFYFEPDGDEYLWFNPLFRRWWKLQGRG